ncbi:MAG: septal ring lytic transglycosylase RlpA family protein [Candidatus Acidiferrales bacterium]
MGAIAFIVAGCSHHNTVSRTPSHSTTPQPSATPPASGATAANPNPSGPPPAIEHQPPIPGQYVEEGVASWYGVPFNGRRTSNGEIYDMHTFTAAHRTLPFNTVVRVTNMRNGKQTEVRINDRGPFVANRIIDLSMAASEAIEMIGTGTAQVRLEIVSETANPTTGAFGVQVGAFLQAENANKLKAQLEQQYPPVSVATYDSPSGTFYRVRVGRFATEDEAQDLANRLHTEQGYTTFVVRIDN